MALALDKAAEHFLEHLRDLKNHPGESLTPYEEFSLDGRTYYFAPGGFLYRKDFGAEEVRGFFCGYLPDEVWHSRIDRAGRLRSVVAKDAEWAV